MRKRHQFKTVQGIDWNISRFQFLFHYLGKNTYYINDYVCLNLPKMNNIYILFLIFENVIITLKQH